MNIDKCSERTIVNREGEIKYVISKETKLD